MIRLRAAIEGLRERRGLFLIVLVPLALLLALVALHALTDATAPASAIACAAVVLLSVAALVVPHRSALAPTRSRRLRGPPPALSRSPYLRFPQLLLAPPLRL
jgi:hypothetical protein